MKTTLLRISLLAITLFEGEALVQAQGTFRNLDFESATVPDIPPGQFGSFEPIGDALPGWNGYLGTNKLTQVLHNSFFTGTANISILGPNWTFTTLIDGSYTVLLQPGVGSQGSPVDASISQFGTIPANAQSFQFKSDQFYHPFAVYIEGMGIPVSILSSNPDYALYGADISLFAGLTREIRISALYDPLGNGFAHLDSIIFSSQPIPEPGVLDLFALGALLFGWRWHRSWSGK